MITKSEFLMAISLAEFKEKTTKEQNDYFVAVIDSFFTIEETKDKLLKDKLNYLINDRVKIIGELVDIRNKSIGLEKRTNAFTHRLNKFIDVLSHPED